MSVSEHSCMSCGACCAQFRCSFYWREADDFTPQGVPVEMTEDVNDFYRAMKGTNCKNPYCIALQGEVGKKVYCSIYERRPSTCRNVSRSFADGTPDEKCDTARAAYGLEPLNPPEKSTITSY